MKIELITWADAGGTEDDSTWMATDDVDDTNPIITSVGFVIKETKANITIAMDLAEDGTTHTRSRIPVAMIVNRVILKESVDAAH